MTNNRPSLSEWTHVPADKIPWKNYYGKPVELVYTAKNPDNPDRARVAQVIGKLTGIEIISGPVWFLHLWFEHNKHAIVLDKDFDILIPPTRSVTPAFSIIEPPSLGK